MKKFISCYLDTFFGKNLDLRVKLFHVLAITGFLICVMMTVISLTRQRYFSMAVNMGAGLVSLGLLIYSTRTGRYRRCYWISILVIFFILFPTLFFFSGGYQGGMTYFFVFAVVFTAFMLDGKGMAVVSALELICYSLLVVLAYRKPQWILPFPSEGAVVADVIIGMVTASIALGATMFVHVRMYQRQQKELEKARQAAESANLAKSIFLANMSHEIRTPIHVILGMNEIIHRETRSRQVREYAQRIEETGKMLLSLVENVLDVSKIESGKMEIHPGIYESGELIRTLSVMGKAQCSRKRLQFHTKINQDLPRVLCGDLPHIRQIASNFLSNAAKYTEKGSVTLSVSQEPGETGILLCISVSDTGIGIAPEALPDIFNAFSRAEGARQIEGTGLGLNIAKQLTDLMDGTLTVESTPGEGSTFTVKLPQTVIPEEKLPELNRSGIFLAPDLSVLVVDDNEGNRAVLKQLLSVTRMQVHTAGSGRECLEKVRQHRYDVILMDYMMPEMDGAETLAELRKLPDFRTPALVLTADAAAETGETLRKAGFRQCLTKPVPWNRLRDALLSCLPSDGVTLLQEPLRRTVSLQEQQAGELLEAYGIRLPDAMEYFEDFSQYCGAAELFIRYYPGEKEKISEFFVDGDWKKLRFSIHSLKGKAGNLGISRLEELCRYCETLCVAGEGEELQSLLPYLLFVWQRSIQGLEQLPEREEKEKALPAEPGSPEQLREALETFQRKPALQWIDGYLLAHPAEDLQTLRKLTEGFRFGEALEEFDRWKQEREEAQ